MLKFTGCNAATQFAAPEAALLYDLLGLQAPARAALAHLRGITPLLPAIEPAVDRFETRLAALEAALLSKPKNRTVSAPVKPTINR